MVLQPELKTNKNEIENRIKNIRIKIKILAHRLSNNIKQMCWPSLVLLVYTKFNNIFCHVKRGRFALIWCPMRSTDDWYRQFQLKYFRLFIWSCFCFWLAILCSKPKINSKDVNSNLMQFKFLFTKFALHLKMARQPCFVCFWSMDPPHKCAIFK